MLANQIKVVCTAMIVLLQFTRVCKCVQLPFRIYGLTLKSLQDFATKKAKVLQLSTLESMEKIHVFQSIELKCFDASHFDKLFILMIHSVNEKYTNKDTVTYRNTIDSNAIDYFQQFFINKHLFDV